METKTITDVTLCLGKLLIITPGAKRELSLKDVLDGIQRHARGDWGELWEHDYAENELSLREGFRLISSYRGTNDTTFWGITEHDRSMTTVLLPEEYQ